MAPVITIKHYQLADAKKLWGHLNVTFSRCKTSSGVRIVGPDIGVVMASLVKNEDRIGEA